MARVDNPLSGGGAESGTSAYVRNLTLGERTVPHPIMFVSLDKEADWQEIPDIQVDRQAEYAYYPGCVDYYDYEMQFSVDNYGETNHGIIFDSSIKLLRALGIDPIILDRSFVKCCGHDQLWQGKVDVWNKMREYNEEVIKQVARKSGFKVLVTSCAEGYRTFKLDYDLGDIQIKHITQVLAERGIQFNLRRKVRVTYQDPCRCGRQMPLDPIYEEPRELIRRTGADYVEMEHFRADAICCGVAGMMYCNEKTKGITNDRMIEASEKDVDYLLTACPKCLTHFGCQAHENQYRDDREKFKFKIVDITQFLAETLEAEGRALEPVITTVPTVQGLRGPGAQAVTPPEDVMPAVAGATLAGVPAAAPKPGAPPPAAPRPAAPAPALSPEERQQRIEEARRKAEEMKKQREAGAAPAPAPPLAAPLPPPQMSPEERQRRIEEARKKAEEIKKQREAQQGQED